MLLLLLIRNPIYMQLPSPEYVYFCFPRFFFQRLLSLKGVVKETQMVLCLSSTRSFWDASRGKSFVVQLNTFEINELVEPILSQ